MSLPLGPDITPPEETRSEQKPPLPPPTQPRPRIPLPLLALALLLIRAATPPRMMRIPARPSRIRPGPRQAREVVQLRRRRSGRWRRRDVARRGARELLAVVLLWWLLGGVILARGRGEVLLRRGRRHGAVGVGVVGLGGLRVVRFSLAGGRIWLVVGAVGTGCLGVALRWRLHAVLVRDWVSRRDRR